MKRIALILFLALPLFGGSLKFSANEPRQYDFADQAVLPPTFGAGEFTMTFWIKPDASFKVGDTERGTIAQLTNWSESDVRPYASHGWWYGGNWLLDGHSRPNGFSPGDSRAGTFSLQLFGGGRVRWTFADDDRVVPIGMVWAVQPAPAKNAPSLLDGQWHHIACVRRWSEPSGATLELWIDGRMIASTSIPQRVNMRKYWDAVPHPNDPKELGGWSWGAEVMTGWDYFFTQYEDYKGLLDELRFYDRALTSEELSSQRAEARGLVGRFAFDEEKGEVARDAIDAKRVMTLHRMAWSSEDAPL